MVLNNFKLKHYNVFVLVISAPHVMRALALAPPGAAQLCCQLIAGRGAATDPG